MAKPLWAPWRLEYIEQADAEDACVFCREAREELPENQSLVVGRGRAAFALLNKFPYSSGHLLVAPIRHEGTLAGLTDDEALEVHRIAVEAVAVLERTYGPDGFNLGWNFGRSAGAGITAHVHLHVVPRWSGDTNFMPVLADVKVLPEHLLATRDRLREAWSR
jgi:ATP adenylyltransferase